MTLDDRVYGITVTFVQASVFSSSSTKWKQSNSKFQGFSRTQCTFHRLSRPWILIFKFKEFQGHSRWVPAPPTNLARFDPDKKICSSTTKNWLGNWSKQLYSNRTHLEGRRGVLRDTTYLRTLPTTFYCLLNLSWHRNIQLARVGIKWQTRKVRFESHCNFLLLDRGVAMQQRHHLSTLSKVGAGRHHQLFCGLVGPVRV